MYQVLWYKGYKMVQTTDLSRSILIYSPNGGRMAIQPSFEAAVDFVDGCTERFSIVHNNPHVERN